jgi:predicted TPR repeat methyltransferase
MASLERAIRFTKNRGPALDIGCGSHGRMIDLLLKHGFDPEGIDVSAEMVARAKKRHPNVAIHRADVCAWEFPRPYDIILAWDSTWHLPLKQQEPVLKKICAALAPDGVYLFTAGGLDEPVEKSNNFIGTEVPLYHSTLGIPRLLELLTQFGCVCRHLEYDQYPEQHLVVIAQRTST